VFRRRKSEPGSDAPVDGSEVDTGAEVDDVDAAPAAPTGLDRSGGPFDLDEEPEDGLTRLDLGGLRVAGANGMEIRLEIDQNTQAVSAVTVVAGDSAVQLTAFAAPRTEGIWDEVRAEIRSNLAASGPVEEIQGDFGRELQATLTVPDEQGRQVSQPVRFVGVDGPRWFLRGLFTGAAARDPRAAAPLEAVLRAAVVVRGSDPMAPGDPLPLHLPTDVPEGIAPRDDQDRTTLPPPERGPEITEIR
jgi:hypothetical protein